MRRALGPLAVPLFSVFCLASACLGTSPEDSYAESLGEAYDGDELHRPGQPCLACHRDGYDPGDDVFMAAGTVYLTPTSPVGQAGVLVEVTDAYDRTATVTTNSVGNFMFEEGEDRTGEDDEDREGIGRVPFELVFPLRVRISLGDVVQEMESVTWREGSCAHCHSLDGPHEASEPRVYLMEAP